MSHPEWGMITALVSTARASWMMGIFRASQEDRFHRTPEEDSTAKFKKDEAGVRTQRSLVQSSHHIWTFQSTQSKFHTELVRP